MPSRRHAILFFALAVLASPGLLCGRATAADVEVSASVSPTTVSMGDEAVLTVRVQGKFRRTAEPEIPEIDGLTFYQAGTSQNFSFVNGQMNSSITFTYSVTADKEGTFTIAPITFTIGDQQYSADPVTLEVTAASSSVSPPTRSAPGGSAAAPADTSASGAVGNDDSIFITASVDRDTVYVNQQVTWTLGYYSDGRVQLLRSPNYSPPQAEGFWVDDLPPQNKYYTNLHGRRYLVNEIKRAYFPTAPGVYTIGKARVDVVVDDLGRGNIDDFFARSFRSRGFGDAHSLLTEAKKVVVLPLPDAGKPDGFDGIVAENLRVAVSADKQVVRAGEPVNVTMEVNGIGNMNTIAPPTLAESDRYKVYESGSKSDTFKKDYVVSGRKRYDYVVIPQVEGQWTLPAIEMVYFDPDDGVYRTARSHAVPLEVQPGAHEEGRKVIYAGGGDDIDVINRDIRYIHPVPASLEVSPRPLYTRGWYLGLHAIPLLAVVASLFVERRRRRLRDDVGFARSSRALREATRKLDYAGRLFGKNDAEGGYSQIAAAVTGYFADKMNVSAAGLTSETIESFLRSRGAGDDVAASVQRVLSESDAARFAAGAVSPERGREAVAAAAAALKAIEKGHLS